MPESATSLQERPAYFASGTETLFGIVTEPVEALVGVAVILLYPGVYTVSSEYNQYWTRLSRKLASHGFHALRFDHHGNGDASGRIEQFDHRTPFSDDVKAAVHLLESEGVGRFLLVGNCLGARSNLVAAADLDQVEGLYMISTMVRDARLDKAEDWAEEYSLGYYLRRAFQLDTVRKMARSKKRRAYIKIGATKFKSVFAGTQTAIDARRDAKVDNAGASPRFLNPLEKVVGRGVQVRFAFSEKDGERHSEFDQARNGRLGRIIDSAGPRLEVATVGDGSGTMSDAQIQDAMIEDVVGWAARFAASV